MLRSSEVQAEAPSADRTSVAEKTLSAAEIFADSAGEETLRNGAQDSGVMSYFVSEGGADLEIVGASIAEAAKKPKQPKDKPKPPDRAFPPNDPYIRSIL